MTYADISIYIDGCEWEVTCGEEWIVYFVSVNGDLMNWLRIYEIIDFCDEAEDSYCYLRDE